MKFPQGFPSMSRAGGYWDRFVNGDDSFHNLINVLDFPLESVEEDKGITDNSDPHFQRPGLFNSDVSQGLPPLFNSDIAEHDNYVQDNSDTKQLPVAVATDISNTHLPLDSSHLTNPTSFQTQSSYYVVESSSSCSAEKNFPPYPELLVPVKPRTKILRSSTFSRWHLLSLSKSPKKISKSKGKKKMKKLSQLPNEPEFSENCFHQHMPSKRCAHCQAVKTLQWRDGPMGPKTLCDACGVSYKSGCLLPGSRPIASHCSKTKKFSRSQGKEKKTKLSGNIKDDLTNQLQEDFTNPLSYKICTLCNVKGNPPWKDGPVSPSSLCIACGDRYRSGHLLQETHPIASQDPEKNGKMNTRNRKKKRKELPGLPNDSEPLGVAGHQNGPGKRCAHCQVMRTPQWRDGPNGPKSLCNACGVRYRSGRLLPEYRPAASPTFVPSLHSNIHKTVIKMREKPIPKIIMPENDPAITAPPETVPASS